MKLCRVVNMYNEAYDVNIQRSSPFPWGNPYTAKEYGKDKAIDLYREHLYNMIRSKKINRSHLETLRGARLGCTCHPDKCHGDVLAELVNRVFGDCSKNALDI